MPIGRSDRWSASASLGPRPHLVERRPVDPPDTPAEQVHDLRKDAKKLRYLLECFGSLLPKSPRKQFVKRLKALQDNLGEHQDAEVHVAAASGISPRALRDRRVAGHDGRDRAAHRTSRPAPASPPAPSSRTLRGLRHQGHEAGPRRRARRADVMKTARHVQHQGWRRKDDHGGQPRARSGASTAPGCCCGTSTRKGRPPSSSVSSPSSKAAPSGSSATRGHSPRTSMPPTTRGSTSSPPTSRCAISTCTSATRNARPDASPRSSIRSPIYTTWRSSTARRASR